MYCKVSKVIFATLGLAILGVSPALSETRETSAVKNHISATAPKCNASFYQKIMATLALVDTFAPHVLVDYEPQKFRHSLTKEHLNESAIAICAHDKIVSDFRSGFIDGLRLASTQGRGIVEGIATSAETDGDPLTDLTEITEMIANASVVAGGLATRAIGPSIIRHIADKADDDILNKVLDEFAKQDADRSYGPKARKAVDNLKVKQARANKSFRNASKTAAGAGAFVAMVGYELQSAIVKASIGSMSGRGIEMAVQTSSDTDTDPLDSLLGDTAKWGAIGVSAGSITKWLKNPHNPTKEAGMLNPKYVEKGLKKIYPTGNPKSAQLIRDQMAIAEARAAEINRGLKPLRSAATKKAFAVGAGTALLGYAIGEHREDLSRGRGISYCDPYACYVLGRGFSSPRVYEENNVRYYDVTTQPGTPQTEAGVFGVDCRLAEEVLVAQSVDSCEAVGGAVIPNAASFTTTCEIGSELAMTPSPAACVRLGGSPGAQ